MTVINCRFSTKPVVYEKNPDIWKTIYLARMLSAQKQTEFYHSDFDSLKRVRSIWICMDGGDGGDAIEENGLCRETVYGKGLGQSRMDLMKAVIISIRKKKGEATSRHVLLAMLETLFSETAAKEKKRLLAEKYGMVMSVELERRIQVMCNLSEVIIEDAMENGYKKGMEKERLFAIQRIIRAGGTKKQILLYGYSQDEYERAEKCCLQDESI